MENTGLISNNKLSSSKLSGNESNKQVNATNAIDGFVDKIDDEINRINKVLIESMNLVNRWLKLEAWQQNYMTKYATQVLSKQT